MSGVPGWRTLHGTESHTDEGYISNSRHVEKQFTAAKEGVLGGKVRCSNRFCPRRRTTSGGPNMPRISNMRRAFPDKTCTLTGSLAWSLFTKTHRPAKTRGRRSDRPQPRVCVRACVCARAHVCVWRPPAFRQKNSASGAGARPKMTRHWFHRYCRNGCFTRPPSPIPVPSPTAQSNPANQPPTSAKKATRLPDGKTVTQSSSP